MPTVSIAQALQLGIDHHQAGRLVEAEQLYRQVLAHAPAHAGCVHLLGVLAGQQGRMQEAEQWVRKAIQIAPGEPVFHINLGKLLMQAGRPAEALPPFREGARLTPDSWEAWFELGAAAAALGRQEEALQAYQAADRHLPDNPGILCNLAGTLRAMGRTDQAAQCFLRAIQADPGHVASLGNLGQLLESQGRYEEAMAFYQRALRADPGHPTLHYNMGVSLGELGRLDEAAPFYREAIRLKPDYFEAWNNLANAFSLAARHEEAIDAYRETLRLNPNLSEAWSNLGAALMFCARHDEASAAIGRALALRPDSARAHSNLLYGSIFIPGMDARAIRAEHARWNQLHGAPHRPRLVPHPNGRDPERPLRIGYVSPDFRDHVVARNLVPLFQRRDRGRFTTICFANNTLVDSLTDTMRSLSDEWHDIRFLSDDAAAQLVRDRRIDILVDISLHMARNRMPIFARKPAPVQVTFAGYPGSTGLETMDYRLTDPHLDPPGTGDEFYCEKSVRLPHTFWCYDPLGEDAVPSDVPAASKGFITFGCLNAFCKVNDPLLGLWGRVLAAVPGSRLRILSSEGGHRARTLGVLREQGVAPERVSFTRSLPRSEYLRLYHEIDIVLDPLPYNGHTTSLDALWMGVPVVTMVGQTVVGRAGYSQLMNLGLPELITHDAESYVRAAAELARDLPRLRALRGSLRGRMERSPLMDGAGFTRAIEAAYREMWRTWCAGNTP